MIVINDANMKYKLTRYIILYLFHVSLVRNTSILFLQSYEYYNIIQNLTMYQNGCSIVVKMFIVFKTISNTKNNHANIR